MRRQELQRFVQTALECTIYIAPRATGLSAAELIEVGKRLSFEDGELRDAVNDAVQYGDAEQSFGNPRLQPKHNFLHCNFHQAWDPEPRNIAALDYVLRQLAELGRKEGRRGAKIDRSVLVARAVTDGLQEDQVEVALAALVFGDRIVDENDTISFASGKDDYPLPSAQLAQSSDMPKNKRDLLRQMLPIVRDVIERRTDGRAQATEPLDAFAEHLAPLGFEPFRLWWKQTVAELRRLDPGHSPVATCVLAAALVEGALTFVVRHARNLNLGVFKSKDFDGAPRTWKIDDLVKSAASGGDSAILDNMLRTRADALILTRQRIHAGRMLADFPGGAPDLRPEEARDARTTAELVVRRVVDWLVRYPATSTPSGPALSPATSTPSGPASTP